MISNIAEWLRARWSASGQTRFGCLFQLFLVRMFRGSGDTEAGGLDPGVGAMLILLAMPGTLASLLALVEYGSLLRFIRGQPAFDPFAATIPDEYFFIVLSLVVNGAVALWRWDAIFLDRRDYMNLVPLPLSLRSIFFANLCAIVALVGLLTVAVNGVSLLLFPIAVVGSQGSTALFLRFAAGHAGAVLLASAFSFFAVLAVAGVLMVLLPAFLFRRVWLSIRFLGMVGFLALLATCFAVPDWLNTLPARTAHRIATLPPVAFLGIARTLWGRGTDSLSAEMAKDAWLALGITVVAAILAYSLSFRRSFLRIPETADVSALPRIFPPGSPMAALHGLTLRAPSERACYRFVARTLLRSEGHLQVLLGLIGVAVVAASEILGSAPFHRPFWMGSVPSLDFLAVPFILGYCIVIGVRLAFEIPLDLRANWIFRFWLDPDKHGARSVARRILLTFSLACLAPAEFVVTAVFWGWTSALLHMAAFVACIAVLVEIVIVRLRRIPFTYPYPTFQSHSPIMIVAYTMGYFLFTTYFARFDRWCLLYPKGIMWLYALLGGILAGLSFYRRQLLDIDKQLTFENQPASGF